MNGHDDDDVLLEVHWHDKVVRFVLDPEGNTETDPLELRWIVPPFPIEADYLVVVSEPAMSRIALNDEHYMLIMNSLRLVAASLIDEFVQ